MDLLMFIAPPAVAGALVAVAVSTLCYGLISVARLFPHGQAIVTTIVLVGLSTIPIGTYLWLESLDLDGGEGLTAFLIAVFFCASGCFSMAFLVGLLLERRRKRRRQCGPRTRTALTPTAAEAAVASYSAERLRRPWSFRRGRRA